MYKRYICLIIRKRYNELAKTIIFGQQKGGVGKTTDTVMTALIASLVFNKKTAVIDTDLQGNATRF